MGYNMGTRLADDFCARQRGAGERRRALLLRARHTLRRRALSLRVRPAPPAPRRPFSRLRSSARHPILLARTGAAKCRTFRETLEAVAGPALRMFLGVTAVLENWNAEGTVRCLAGKSPRGFLGRRLRARALAFRAPPPPLTRRLAPLGCLQAVSLRLPDNPLADFVELPPAYSELRYSNVLCGALRGALEMVSLRVDARFVRDTLNGDDATEIRVQLKEVLADTAGSEYQDE